MSIGPEELLSLARRRLIAEAVPGDAGPMQAYMKSEMPFYGVKRPARRRIERELVQVFQPTTRAQWEAGVLALWGGSHREERYLALAMARRFKRFLTIEALPLLERLIREGAWWDLVDEVTTQLVARVSQTDRQATLRTLDRWAQDDDVWVRRAAIIGQLKAKEHTDLTRLFGYCERHAGDRSFWIRKAIGWALREAGKTFPDEVVQFVHAHQVTLSGLSRREALKHLG